MPQNAQISQRRLPFDQIRSRFMQLVSKRGISRAIANHRALEGTRDLDVRARLIHNDILDR